MVLGEIRPCFDVGKISGFVWDGKRFMPRNSAGSHNVWIRKGNSVVSASLPSLKLRIRGLKYTFSHPGLGLWFLRFEPIRFVSLSKSKVWVFSRGIWRLYDDCSSGDCFIVEGKVPFWGALLVLAGAVSIF